MKFDIFIESDFARDNNLVDYINAVAYELGLYGEGIIDRTLRIEFNKKLDADAGGFCYGDAEEIDIEIVTHIQGEALDIEQIKMDGKSVLQGNGANDMVLHRVCSAIANSQV